MGLAQDHAGSRWQECLFVLKGPQLSSFLSRSPGVKSCNISFHEVSTLLQGGPQCSQLIRLLWAADSILWMVRALGDV